MPKKGDLVRPRLGLRSLDYVVTGTGRCGTVWFSRMLTENGIACGHESVFDVSGEKRVKRYLKHRHAYMSIVSTHRLDENGEWQPIEKWWADNLRADASYMSAPFLNEPWMKETKKVHLIRNPFEVVSSYCGKMGFFKKPHPYCEWQWFIFQHADVLRQESLNQLDRACLFYVEWIKLIERCEEIFVHRLEDGITDQLSSFFGVDRLKSPQAEEAKNDGFRGKFDFVSVDQIKNQRIRERFQDTGEKYGYNMQKQYKVFV